MDCKTKDEQEIFEHDKLSEKEKEEGKHNGFILVGKTGAGKSTLLNVIFNKEVSGTPLKDSDFDKIKIYYYKLTNGKVVSLLDTPGIIDDFMKEERNMDFIHLNKIKKIINKEKVHLKGILFLTNFQQSRFYKDEQDALLAYNSVFPIKNFWKKIVLINTHVFADPNDDEDLEEIINNKNIYMNRIFETINEKVKNVSDTISYKDLKVRYFNSYSFPNNNKKKESNNKTRKELEAIFEELIENKPLINQIEIQHIKNRKWTENGKEYIGEIVIIGAFDLNEEPIKIKMNVIKKEEIMKQQNYSSVSSKYYVYKAIILSKGPIQFQILEGNKDNSNLLKLNEEDILWKIIGETALAGNEIIIPEHIFEQGTSLNFVESNKDLAIRKLFDLFS